MCQSRKGYNFCAFEAKSKQDFKVINFLIIEKIGKLAYKNRLDPLMSNLLHIIMVVLVCACLLNVNSSGSVQVYINNINMQSEK